MVTSRHRLSKLEQRISPPSSGKLIVARGGSTDAEVTELLKAADIDQANPAHTIVVLRTLCETKDGSEYPFPTKAEILHVMDKK